jgi:hypothetical protein
MSKLVFEQIRSELKVNDQGVGYCSIRGAARLAGINESSIRRGTNIAAEPLPGLAQSLILQGFEAAALENVSLTGVPDFLLAGILEYYAFDAGNHCTDSAKVAYKAFASTGIRAVIQDICGYKKEMEKPKSAIELFRYQLAIAEEHEQRLLQLEEENQKLLAAQEEIHNIVTSAEERIDELEQTTEDRLVAIEVEQDRFQTPAGHKYTVLGYARLQGLELSNSAASVKGRKATRLCRDRGIEVEQIHDPRYGYVGLYPESLLREVFAQ